MMMEHFFFLKRYVPRWTILLLDLIISIISLITAYFLRFNFNIPQQYLQSFSLVIPIYSVTRIISFLIFKTYAGIVRYTSTKDALRIFATIVSGTIFLMFLNLVYFTIVGYFLIPYSVLLIEISFSIALLLVIRLIVKALYFESLNGKGFFKNVIIYGGDDYGLATKRTLERDPSSNFKVVAFVDNLSKGKTIDGVPVFGVNELEEVLDNYKIQYLILSKKEKFPNVEKTIIDICLEKNIKILKIPSADEWINGQLSFNQIKKIRIEDLLERDEIILDEKNIFKTLVNKKVLVTGAAGSIGSEIVRQLTKFNPKRIIILDQAESPMYDLELELLEKFKFKNFDTVIGDITDKVRLKRLFEAYRPEIVFHAAAYKHVPMMENNPYEAVKTNIGGTKILADLSVEYNIEKFVMISTDKAVNPTNIMGASKRIAEIYTQSYNKISQTKFITTRFGNVLGSNGSVIPRFRKQIEEGGPVTVTHPEITRYFMTIPEACQLVLEAAAFGQGGEIFIFDMGNSVKIVDLAKKMIKLSGLTLGIDIEIKFTGLRPGEKLYEELLNDKENTIPTHHNRIMIAKVKEYEFNKVREEIDELLGLLANHNNMEIVAKMKKIVPEFKSKNSIYEALD